MKKYLLPAVFAMALATSAHATVTVALDAGDLTTASGAAAEPTGDLLMLVASPTGSFGAITAGSYASAGTLLEAFAMNNYGGGAGHSETNNTLNFTIPGGISAGNDVELLWFPTITYSQYLSGTTPIGGTAYGSYAPSPLGSTPADGGSAWVVPADGSTVDFDFYTSNSVGGGDETPAQGQANSVVATPEPSSIAFCAVGLAGAVGMIRRRIKK